MAPSARTRARRGPVRFALIGLGHIAQAAVLPAFAHAGSCRLAALLSDDATKRRQLGKRYGAPAYRPKDLERCIDEASIEALYIATPNSEHHAMVLRAARAGVHILCEKPLGVTERECREMIRACDRAGVRLMTAYRLHFEAANLRALEHIRKGTIGDPRLFTSVFSFQIKSADNVRLKRRLGGGPLMDIGIYCINAARSIFAAEPEEVHAWSVRTKDRRFREVDETVTAQLRFPGNRLAQFTCSFGLAPIGWYQVVGTKGDVRVDPAYEYAGGLNLTLTVNEKSRSQQFAKRDQFAAELVHFARCIREGKSPEPSGHEGLADVRVIGAIQASLERSRPVTLPPPVRVRHPKPSQRIDRPPVPREPRLVKAKGASS